MFLVHFDIVKNTGFDKRLISCTVSPHCHPTLLQELSREPPDWGTHTYSTIKPTKECTLTGSQT